MAHLLFTHLLDLSIIPTKMLPYEKMVNPACLIVCGAGGYLVWKWDFRADYAETIFPQDTVIYSVP
jgi:hypothetical protein